MTRKQWLAGAVALSCATPVLADTLPVIADSQVNLSSVALKGGALTTTTVKNSLPGAAYRAFVKFDLRALPSGLPVTKATLRLWPNLVTTAGTIDLSAVLGPWDEATLAAIIAPAMSQPIIDFSVAKTDLKTYVNVDVTELVKDWVDGDLENHGLALVGQPGSSVNARFDSKENATTSHPMELEVMLGLPEGSGDITSIVPGFGLTGGGNLGDVSLAVNTAQVQQRVAGNCPTGSSIRLIDSFGNVTCQPGDVTGIIAGTGLSGGGSAGDITLSTNTSVIQARVSGTCVVGSSVRAVNADGSVVCQSDTSSAGLRDVDGSFSTTVSSAFSWGCKTSPYTATSGDRAFVWAHASCPGTPVGAGLGVRAGYNTGGADTTLGSYHYQRNTGTVPGDMANGQFATLSLAPGATYVFSTAVVNSNSSASWSAQCHCHTMVQVVR